MKHFSPKAFQALRRSAGYTQKSLAEAIGTTERHIQFWEHGEHLPTADYLLRAMVLLHCTADELLTD